MRSLEKRWFITRRKWGIPKIVCIVLNCGSKRKTVKKQLWRNIKSVNDVKCFLQMRRPWKIFTLSSIPAFHTRRCDLIIWDVLKHLVFLTPSLFSEGRRGQLGLILMHLFKVYARNAMTDIDKFTRYSWLDKIWIIHECQASYVMVVRVIKYNSTLSFWNQKERCPFVTFEHS